jgi:hypothetical protein
LLLDKAVRLSALLEWFSILAHLTMSGKLSDVATVVSVRDHLWSRLMQWAAERGSIPANSQELSD